VLVVLVQHKTVLLLVATLFLVSIPHLVEAQKEPVQPVEADGEEIKKHYLAAAEQVVREMTVALDLLHTAHQIGLVAVGVALEQSVAMELLPHLPVLAVLVFLIQ
jgi:hypothetical protein